MMYKYNPLPIKKQLIGWALILSVVFLVVEVVVGVQSFRESGRKAHEGHEALHAQYAVALAKAQEGDIVIKEDRTLSFVAQVLPDKKLHFHDSVENSMESFDITVEQAARLHYELVPADDPRWKDLVRLMLSPHRQE